MTSRLRELIQQLGEAIHESVIESEQIAGVVQDIRQHGFDVLLMLEATIGLNDVAKGAEGGRESRRSERRRFAVHPERSQLPALAAHLRRRTIRKTPTAPTPGRRFRTDSPDAFVFHLLAIQPRKDADANFAAR